MDLAAKSNYRKGAESMTEFQYNIDCPICHNSRNDCRANGDIIFCREYTNSSGLNYLGQDKIGFNMYADSKNPKNPKNPKNSKKTENKTKKDNKTKVNNKNRDISIRNILEQSELSQKDLLELQRRGLEENIAKKYFRSIENKNYYNITNFPGFNSNGYYFHCRGMICPCISPKKEYLGFQIKTDNPNLPKYIWPKSKKENITSHVNVHGKPELPMAFWGWEKNNPLNLIEGILKPAIAWNKYPEANWCGASGGNFSVNQIKEAVEIFQPPWIQFFPDAGSGANPQTAQRDLKTIFSLLELNIPIYIADWGQLENKFKGDFDEIPQNEIEKIKFISPIEYKNKILKIEKDRDPDVLIKDLKAEFAEFDKFSKFPSIKTSDIEENVKVIVRSKEERKKAYKKAYEEGYKFILDSSGTGTGKSYTVGELKNEDFGGSKIFYINRSARNPSNENIEENFKELPARHNGLEIDKYEKTPKGNPVRQRPRENTENNDITRSNCHWEHRHRVLANKNKNTKEICKNCPFYQDCKKSTGEGYGFLYEISQALTHQKIRANINGVNPDFIDRDVLIFDEAFSIEPYQKLEIKHEDISEISSLKVKNEENLNFIKLKILEILELIHTEKRYGLLHKEIMEVLGDPPFWLGNFIKEIKENKIEDDKELIQKERENLVSKNWILYFLEVWNKDRDGSFSILKNNSFNILIRNDQLQSILEKAKIAIFLDATASKKDLANKLAISEDEIFHISSEKDNMENITINQITGLGKAGKDRSKSLQDRINALIKYFENDYVGDVGIIDFAKFAQPGWLKHFSNSKGSNEFEEKNAILMVGAPYPHIGEIANEYSLQYGIGVDISNPSDHFKEFYGNRFASEIFQEIGRLRASNRKEEILEFYFAADFDIEFLLRRGFNIKKMSAASFSIDAASNIEKSSYLISKAFEKIGSNVSKIAKEINQSRSNVSKCIKKFGGINELVNFVKYLLMPEKIDRYIPEDAIWLANNHIGNMVQDGISSDYEKEEFIDMLNILKEEYKLNNFEIAYIIKDDYVRVHTISILMEFLPVKLKENIVNFYYRIGNSKVKLEQYEIESKS